MLQMVTRGLLFHYPARLVRGLPTNVLPRNLRTNESFPMQDDAEAGPRF